MSLLKDVIEKDDLPSLLEYELSASSVLPGQRQRGRCRRRGVSRLREGSAHRSIDLRKEQNSLPGITDQARMPRGTKISSESNSPASTDIKRQTTLRRDPPSLQNGPVHRQETEPHRSLGHNTGITTRNYGTLLDDRLTMENSSSATNPQKTFRTRTNRGTIRGKVPSRQLTNRTRPVPSQHARNGRDTEERARGPTPLDVSEHHSPAATDRETAEILVISLEKKITQMLEGQAHIPKPQQLFAHPIHTRGDEVLDQKPMENSTKIAVRHHIRHSDDTSLAGPALKINDSILRQHDATQDGEAPGAKSSLVAQLNVSHDSILLVSRHTESQTPGAHTQQTQIHIVMEKSLVLRNIEMAGLQRA